MTEPKSLGDSSNRALWITGLVLLLGLFFGLCAHAASAEKEHVLFQRETLLQACHLRTPGIDKRGQKVCIPRECDNHGHLTCAEYGWDPKYQAMLDRESDLDSRQTTFQVLAFLSVYLVVGWYLHSLVHALLLRYLKEEWALFATLIVDALSMNVVGTIRAIIGISRLPIAASPEP